MSWEKVKLQDITEYITDGDHQPAPKSDSGIYFIKIKDIISNKISFDNALFVPKEYYQKLRENKKPQKNDVLYTVVGSFGIASYVNNNIDFCFERNIALLHPNDKVNPYFLYLSMRSERFYQEACNIANGAAQKLIPLSKLQNLEIPLPPLDIQNRIASILSRYDDLIENYQHQIQLLEEAAQRLYKEWFVDLHFPGYENTNIVDGVPEGWEKKSVGELGSVITGKTPSTSNTNYYGGNIPFVTIPDMHCGIYPQTSTFLTKEGADSQKGKYLPKDSLIVSCIGTAGLVGITQEICQTNQQINSLILNDRELLYYMFCKFKQLKEHLNNIGSNGATMTNVNKSKFEKIEIIIPRTEELRNFSKYCTSIFLHIRNLTSQVRLLTEARDRLLPKLMSGEITV